MGALGGGATWQRNRCSLQQRSGGACSVDPDSATFTSKGKPCFFLHVLSLIGILNKKIWEALHGFRNSTGS